MKKMYHNLVKQSKFLLVSATLLVSVITKATTCPNAIIIPGGTTFPTPATAVTCGTTNDITSANSTSCGNANYKGGFEALYMYTPVSNVTGFTVSFNGGTTTDYVGITIYQGCPTSGGICLGSVFSSAFTKTTTAISLTAGTTYYIMFDTWPTPASPCPGTFILNGTTTPPPCTTLVYGASAAGFTGDDEIFNVTLGTLNNSSTCTTLAGGAGSVLEKYSNYSGIVTPPSITAGLTYTFSATVGQCGTLPYSGNVTVYMDFNQNGSFADAGEMVYVSPYTLFAVAGTTISASIVIPVTALAGTTRMRVIANETTATTATPPTAAYNWGETEDYCVTILASPGCFGTPNAGIAAITSSVGCPGNAITVSGTGLTTSSGITLQWQSAAASTGPWASIATGTTSSFATSTTTTTFYRLVTTCTTSALSATSSVVSYSVVNPGPCVCNAYPLLYSSSTLDEEITNVTVGSMNNSSTCTSLAGGAGSILNRYGNYAGFVTGPTAAQSSSVSFSLTQTSCGGVFSNLFQIYVDWNQDGDWLDVDEKVYSQSASVSGNQTVTGSFTVPVTAVVGTTRMRVVNVETTSGTTNYAHTTYGYGETEDYCITVTAAPAGCAGTPNTGTTSISSATSCPGSVINLTTSGLSTGVGIAYQWSSASSATGPWTNIIGATATTYSFSSAAGTTFYRLVTTCTTSATSNTTNVVSNTGSGLSITVNSGAICSGSSFTMTPTGATSYTYSGGSAVVSPGTTTSYTVTGATAGCIGSAVTTVTVNPNPTVSASASNTFICIGGSAVLTASTSATSYTWNTGATTMSISVSPTVTTTYSVNASNATSCSSSAAVTITVSTCTGIDELIANAVTVYPNPNNGIINITLTSELTKNSTLEIYDAIGKLIVTEVLSNELNTLNISNLSNGIYSFRVLNNNNMVKSGKLVKQ